MSDAVPLGIRLSFGVHEPNTEKIDGTSEEIGCPWIHVQGIGYFKMRWMPLADARKIHAQLVASKNAEKDDE